MLIQSSSAAGKSSLMDAVLGLMPEEERIQYNAMTGQSLYYLGETSLQHKILAISEEEGVRQAAYALKLLQSDGDCAEIPACRDNVIKIGLGALVGAGVATSAMEQLSDPQKTNVMLAAMSGDKTLIDNLSSSERTAYEEWKGNQGLITVFPAGEKDPTGGKLENPAQDQNKGTMLVTPDQSGEQGANNTGNTDGKADTGGNTTTTPIAEQNSDDLAYLAEGRDDRLPIPEPTVASNGLKIGSNSKHTPGAQGFRPDAGIEPQDSLRLFEQSIPSTKQYPNKEVRFSVDSKGNVHRLTGTNGEYHWNGSTGDKNALTSDQIPSSIQKQLGVRIK